MTLTRNKIVDFYKGTNYREIFRIRGLPPRPREWNVPIFLERVFSDVKNVPLLQQNVIGKTIDLTLDSSNLLNFRSTLLHESLFSFYKSFYNYLAARRLYGGGIDHWIDITCYYSKLYLARALTTLIGIQKYQVRSDTRFFIKDIYKIVNPTRFQKLQQKYGSEDNIEFDKERVSYTVCLKLDIENNSGNILFNTDKVSSHQDIWETYSLIDVEGLGITKFTYDELGLDYHYLIDERNQENYSFEGYKQLDFNLGVDNFPGYFERDHIKRMGSLIYDDTIGIVLGVFQELYHLYKDFEINEFPIELAKFHYMIDYMLDESVAKKKLLDLCNAGFPLKNKYIDEMNEYFSS